MTKLVNVDMIVGDWIQYCYREGHIIDFHTYTFNLNFPQAGREADQYWNHVLDCLRGFYCGERSKFLDKVVKGVEFRERSGPNGVTFDPVKEESGGEADAS